MRLKYGDQVCFDAEVECVTCEGRTLVIQGQTLPRCAECGGRDFRKLRDVAKRMVFLSQPTNPRSTI